MTVGVSASARIWELMVMVKLAVVAVLPSASVTLTVMACDPACVGVPEISPLADPSDKPEGRVPLTKEKVFVPTPPDEETVRE